MLTDNPSQYIFGIYKEPNTHCSHADGIGREEGYPPKPESQEEETEERHPSFHGPGAGFSI